MTRTLQGITVRLSTNAGTAFITINDYGGEPYELFLRIGKAGTTIGELAEAIGRLVSLIFQLEDGTTRADREKLIRHQLEGIGISAYVPEALPSVPDAVAEAFTYRYQGDKDDTTTVAGPAES